MKAGPRSAAFAVLAAAALAMPCAVTAAGSRDLGDAWLVSPADAVGAGAPAWQVGIATGHLFGLAELAQWRLDVAAVRRGWRAGLAWERLGTGLITQDDVRVQAGLGRAWSLGLEGGADRLILAGDEPLLCPALALRAAGTLGTALRLEVWVHLHEPPPWHGTTGLRRLALLTGRHDGWAWAVGFDRAADGRPSLQGDVLARVAAAACLGLRVDPWSGALGLTTAWRLPLGWLRTSHVVHPDLGTTHRWALVIARGEGSGA